MVRRRRLIVSSLGERLLLSVFTVNTIDDSGPGSLRQAIASANAMAGPDTINFSSPLFATPQTIELTSGQLPVTDGVIINGPGASLATISGNKLSRIFQIQTNLGVTISGVTLTEGSDPLGGAIDNTIQGGPLTIDHCIFQGNIAGVGGAINCGYSLTILNSTISNNSAAQAGGGIYLIGSSFTAPVTLTISGSTVADNSAQRGAGILLASQFSATASLSLIDSTLSGNQANDVGGGLSLSGPQLNVTIRNATVSGNSAVNAGGGIALGNAGGIFLVQNSTVTANSAGMGGGIRRTSGSMTVELESSIVAGNTAISSGADASTSGTVTAVKSLIGTGVGIGVLNADVTTSTLLGQPPLLGPLSNNGGPTRTHLPLSGSPAFDNGSNPANVANDQRGTGFPRVRHNGPDIGSVESSVLAPRVQAVVINGGQIQRSRVTSITVDFDSVVSLPTPAANAFELRRQSDNSVIPLIATVTSSTFTRTMLTFAGSQTENSSLPDGRYTLTIAANQVSASGMALDGNGDGVAGDNYVLIGSPATNKLFRLLGDADGDGDNDIGDFAALRLTFGSSSVVFDFDNDGDVDLLDFVTWRSRFGSSI